jgi:hypothetical protein
MADALYGGRAFRTLNLIDEGNRQVLGIEVAHSIPSLRVIRVMEQLIEPGLSVTTVGRGQTSNWSRRCHLS